MPQRFLKPGLITSKKWDGLSWMAQSFYVRILTLVDDFGRYHAHPVLLRSHAFPLREDIRTGQVKDLCKELSDATLALFYIMDGKEYLQLTNWTERVRAAISHFPEIPSDQPVLIPQRSAADCGIPQPPKSPSSSPSPPSPFDAERVYAAYPLKVGRPKALQAIIKALTKFGLERVLSRTEQFAKARNGDTAFMPHPTTWFNQERFNDDPATWKRENHGTNGAKSFDRNKGTCNEGKAAQYDLGRIQAAEPVQDPGS